MCNYKYQHLQHELSGLPCIYPEFYKNHLSKFDKAKGVPIDNEGYCLFHSKNNKWKKENGFSDKFEELIKVFNQINDKKEANNGFNFSGFCFLEDEPYELSKNAENRYVDFSYTEFPNDLIIKDIRLSWLNISNSHFRGKVFVKNLYLNSNLDSTHTAFDKGIEIINSTLDNYSYFDKSTFRNLTDRYSTCFVLKNSTVSYLNFENSTFETSVIFNKNIFTKEVVFHKCIFSDEFYLHEVEINGVISFRETSFLLSENANPMYSSVDFLNVIVKEKGGIVFQGKTPMEDMVKGEMQISFGSDPQGLIVFENFNLNKIFTPSKVKLLELEKTGKVEIGKGCRKYYCQTGLFHIKTEKANQKLILDIVNVFANYFEIKSHSNLGVEIVERSPEQISYFFFTDEKITELEFEQRIKQNEYDLWETFANLSKYAGNSLRVQLVEEKETLIELAAIFLKIQNRINSVGYDAVQFNQLLAAISVDGVSVIESKDLYWTVKEGFSSFYKNLPSPNINRIIMNNPIHISGNVKNLVIGDHNTQNNHSIEDYSHDKLFENISVTDDQKAEIISQINDLKNIVDSQKKESMLSKFIKDWMPVLGETGAKIAKAFVE